MSIPFLTKPDHSESEQYEFIEQPERLKDIPGKANKNLWYRWLKFGFRLACTILLLAFLLKSVDWSKFLKEFSYLDDGGLLIAVIVGVFGILVSSYQWQNLLDAEQIHVDLKKLINYYLVGIAFNHFLPTGMGGDVVKAYYVGKESHNHAGSASAVVMSRITGFLGMLLVSVPALFVWHALFSREITITFLLACFALCTALCGIVLGVILLPLFMQGKWAKKRMLASTIHVGNTIRKSIAQPRSLLTAILLGMCFHVGAALNYYSYAQLLHMHIPITFYLVAIPFVSLATFLPFSINGYGLREGALIFIFSTMHIPNATSLMLTLLVDIQALLFGVIGGCIYLMMGRRAKKQFEVRKKSNSELVCTMEGEIYDG